MADDIINSGGQSTPPTEEKTTAQKSAEYANRYSKASEVVDNAASEYQHGKEVNAEYSNSGLNTTVAKDSEGKAIGTYNWEAQAEHTAKMVYNSDVLAARQDAAASKQELIANQEQGQTQHDMASYSANQSAEKAGWTGGYILDSNRQVAFLKESIKANLYSQEELQKYGYDTALAAARANYDLKKSELAMQNYNTAVQNAFQMAEFTGKFISPETSFHLSQRGVAQQILDDPNATKEDKAKAKEVISAVDSWFEGNDISKEGVYCMSVLMQNFAQASEAQKSIADAWDKFNATLASNQEAVDTANKEAQRTGMFSYVDEYGNIQKVSANWAAAMVGTMPEGFENWSDTAKAEYKSTLGNVIAGDLKNRVEAHEELLNKDFADEASAQAAISNAIFDIKDKYSDDIDDVAVGEINITVTINGTIMSIPLTSSTVAGYKTKYSEPSSATIKLKNTTSTINADGSITIKGADDTDYNTIRSVYSDNGIKGLDNIDAGQNFHISREGNDWDLEIWSTITPAEARNQQLAIDGITKTGLYHVNNTNNYIKDYIDKNITGVKASDYADLGTVYYVKVNTDGTKSICIVGSQKHLKNQFENNYGAFIKNFK